MKKTPLERFTEKISPEPNSGCWLWIGACGTGGYGNIVLNRSVINAHRLSWLLHYGSIPNGMCVLHKCDVRCCVNPEHLFLGTDQDNMDDCKKKGRRRFHNSEKTHCIHGHPLSGANLRVDRFGRRSCNACSRTLSRRYYRQKHPAAKIRGPYRLKANNKALS